MLTPNVIEIRRGSAHCLAVAASAGLGLRPTSAAFRYVSPSDATQPSIHDAFLTRPEAA